MKSTSVLVLLLALVITPLDAQQSVCAPLKANPLRITYELNPGTSRSIRSSVFPKIEKKATFSDFGKYKPFTYSGPKSSFDLGTENVFVSLTHGYELHEIRWLPETIELGYQGTNLLRITGQDMGQLQITEKKNWAQSFSFGLSSLLILIPFFTRK